MQQTIASDEIQGRIWEGAGGAHSPLPPPTSPFVIKLVFCIQICLRHQSVTPFPSGALLGGGGCD